MGVALNARLDFAAVRRFFAQSQIPYVVLPQAKGIPDEFGPGYLGTVASAAGDAVLVNMIERSDCLLGVGFEPMESAQDWHLRQPVYSLANSSIAFGDFEPVSECVGDVTSLLDRLLEGYSGGARWTTAEIRGAQDADFAGLAGPFAGNVSDVKRPFRDGLRPAVCDGGGAHPRPNFGEIL